MSEFANDTAVDPDKIRYGGLQQQKYSIVLAEMFWSLDTERSFPRGVVVVVVVVVGWEVFSGLTAAKRYSWMAPQSMASGR